MKYALDLKFEKNHGNLLYFLFLTGFLLWGIEGLLVITFVFCFEFNRRKSSFAMQFLKTVFQ